MINDQDGENAGWLYRGRLRDVMVVLCVVSAFFFPLDAATRCLGAVLLALGCALHILVKGQLVRNVVLCTEGTYAIVRHPYYLANYLIDVSFCLLSGNIFLLVVYPFLFFWAYQNTFREEEKRLFARHGSAFAAHQATVPQVFPDATVFGRLRAIGKGFSWRRVTSGEIKRQLRFVGAGLLLTLLREVGLTPIENLMAGNSPLDADDTALLAVCLVMFLASALTPREKDPVFCS